MSAQPSTMAQLSPAAPTWSSSLVPADIRTVGGPTTQLLTMRRPDGVQRQLDHKRGLPDISYNADPYTPILVYVGFLGSGNAGYYSIGGTSEGAPQWAGIVADLNQYAGRPLGFLNTALYSIGGDGDFNKIGRDIKVGNNAYNGVLGYDATPGWDLTTGWGTPDLDRIMSRALELLDPTTDD
jgi:hypothetical protein